VLRRPKIDAKCLCALRLGKLLNQAQLDIATSLSAGIRWASSGGGCIKGTNTINGKTLAKKVFQLCGECEGISRRYIEGKGLKQSRHGAIENHDQTILDANTAQVEPISCSRRRQIKRKFDSASLLDKFMKASQGNS